MSLQNRYSQIISKRQRPVDKDTDLENFSPLNRMQEAEVETQNKSILDSLMIGGEQVQGIEKNEFSASSSSMRKKTKKSSSSKQKSVPVVNEDLGTKEKKPMFLAKRSTTRFAHLAGLETIIEGIKELVFYPLQYPKLYSHLGVTPPCGILLHGPSGCGKTALAMAIAGELNLPFYKASGPELVGGTSGESEERIRDIFEAAMADSPSVLFIDALDVIAAKKDSSNRAMDRRILAQLFDSIDLLSAETQLPSIESKSLNGDSNTTTDINRNNSNNIDPHAAPEKDDSPDDSDTPHASRVVLIVATNKPDTIDAGVRGRFSREIALPVPDAASRTKILRLLTANTRVSDDVDLTALGKITPGFVGSDLKVLVREAGMIAVSRIVASTAGSGVLSPQFASFLPLKDDEQQIHSIQKDDDLKETESSPLVEVSENKLERYSVEMADFLKAAKSIQPTAKREGFAVAPDVTWADVGALANVRDELQHNVLDPIAHPERFRRLGLEVPAGVLFFGPPGCGKTLLAKALANQSGANFISVKGPELLNLYVGESESRVRQVFSRARASAPCVIFFDELDALCPKRGNGMDGGGGSGNGVTERVVNQLLTELDGLETRRDVYVIAATNRLELIDDAMLRPGRLGKLLYVPLPSPPDRVSILRAIAQKVQLAAEVDLQVIGSDDRCDGFSGADLAALVREAGLAVIKEMAVTAAATTNSAVKSLEGEDGDMEVEEEMVQISCRHFEIAFSKVRPSVATKDKKRYDIVEKLMKDGVGAIQALSKASAMMK